MKSAKWSGQWSRVAQCKQKKIGYRKRVQLLRNKFIVLMRSNLKVSASLTT